MYFIVKNSKNKYELTYLCEVTKVHTGFSTSVMIGCQYGWISNGGRLMEQGRSFSLRSFKEYLEKFESNRLTDIIYKSDNLDDISHRYNMISELCE